jgi:phage terminase large subunit
MADKNLTDPTLFVLHYLKHYVWSTQNKMLRAVAKHKRVAVKACHSSSKTFTAAELALWWVARYTDGKVLITAPAFRQVSQQCWLEIHRAARGSSFPFPLSKLLQTEFRLSEQNFILGLTATGDTSFQGFHGGHVLIIVDEATGVDASIFEAIEGIAAGGQTHILLLGNPTVTSGPFYDAFTRNRAAWHCITIDAFDTPNLEGLTVEQLLALPDRELDQNPRPYLTTRRWVKERYAAWWNGSPENSPLWQSRVRAEFPSQSENALISLAWLESATRERQGEVEACYAGIDVAGPGSDETVACIVSNGAILETKAWSQPDPRGPVVEFLNRWRDRLRLVRVDEGGIGWGMMLYIRDQKFPTEGINFGSSAREPERFINRKAELYWELRERFRTGSISGLTDAEMTAQLASIRYELDGAGRVMVESKESMRKRGVHSPDRVESLILAIGPPSWNAATGIRLVPSISSYRFNADDPRHRAAVQLASGETTGGFRGLGAQEKADLEEDMRPRIRSSTYVRRIKRGIFSSGF